MCALTMATVLLSLQAAVGAPGRVLATAFSVDGGFYVDRGKWLAVNPSRQKAGKASVMFPYRDGVYDVTLEMVGENDGQSTYEVLVAKQSLGIARCPLSTETYQVGPKYTKTWKGVRIHDGDIIRVHARIASADGTDWSRARWAALAFKPVDGGAELTDIDMKATGRAKTAATPALPPLHGGRQSDGNGNVEISGELKQWHKVTLTLDGPFAHEQDNQPNPFVDRRMDVIFTHESGRPSYRVPAYFAADGNAAESSAESGTKWRAHLSPDKTGTWRYTVQFKGTIFDGKTGEFAVASSDKSGRDLRGKGRLQYVGKRYLRFAGSGEWFLKAGADAPETFLAYADFDGTVANNPGKCPLKTWEAHVRDWQGGDPTWKGGKGKGMIGAINYLAGKGCNAFSFLPYNAGGDGDNVWPHVSRSDKLHFDCSKLDQWGIVFDHATTRGMYLHFKLQETENDDTRGKAAGAAQALDKGDLGVQRKAYLRELIARFAHNLALNWNIGEENTQSLEQITAQIHFIREIDPYGHNIVLHTFPNQHEKVYGPMLGKADLLSGFSMQNSNVSDSHRNALEWVSRSEKAGHPWVVALDEAGNAGSGSPPDPDWPGMKKALARIDTKKLKVPSIDDVRAEVLWGTLMAGGAGVEYYFGYRLPENDLLCQDWRSRDKTWDYSRIALDFFRDNGIPLASMSNANALVGNPQNGNERYCLAQVGEVYLVYLRRATDATLDLGGALGTFTIAWFNPRDGGDLLEGTVRKVSGGDTVSLGAPPSAPTADWVVLIQREG